MEKQVMQEKQEKKVYQPADIKIHQLKERKIIAASEECNDDCNPHCGMVG